MAMKIQITVFWIKMLHSNVVGLQCFGSPIHIHPYHYMASQPRRPQPELLNCISATTKTTFLKHVSPNSEKSSQKSWPYCL